MPNQNLLQVIVKLIEQVRHIAEVQAQEHLHVHIAIHHQVPVAIEVVLLRREAVEATAEAIVAEVIAEEALVVPIQEVAEAPEVIPVVEAAEVADQEVHHLREEDKLLINIICINRII